MSKWQLSTRDRTFDLAADVKRIRTEGRIALDRLLDVVVEHARLEHQTADAEQRMPRRYNDPVMISEALRLAAEKNLGSERARSDRLLVENVG